MINAVVVLKVRLADWPRSQAIPSLGTRLYLYVYKYNNFPYTFRDVLDGVVD